MMRVSADRDRTASTFGRSVAATVDGVDQIGSIGATVATRSARAPHGAARIGAFFLLVLAAIVAADRLINMGLHRVNTGPFGVFNKIVDGRINADILVTGSSRALTHFDPEAITNATGLSAFNIGLNGSQTDMQVAAFKTYLRHNRKPRLLVHNLDSFTFVTSHGEVYFPGQYLPYLNEPDIYRALREINPEFWKSKWLPLYGYAVEDMNFTWMLGIGRQFGRNPVEDRPRGFQSRYSAWTGDFDRLKASNPDGIQFEVEAAGVEQLEDLMAVCNQQGIKVLLVYSPVYYEVRTLERNRKEIFSLFSTLAGRHRATLWDFSDSPVAFVQENFYNSQHLNATGAAAFSKEFAARLAAYLGDPVEPQR